MIKVLIVDDEMIVRHAVKTLIRWDGSRFEYAGSAANGASALELVRETGADIVITDIKMPGMDGLELIKKLTEDGFGGEVLVLSNYNDFELVREALRCGAHDYMLKLTLKTESFMQTLEEMADKLDGKRGRERARTEKSMPDARGEDRSRISAMLQEMDAPASGSAPWQGERFLEDGQRAFAFVVALRPDDRSVRRAGFFQEALDKLADGLFAGSRWVCAVRTDSRRFLLAAAYASEAAAAADPQELARRLASLASMYYNVRIGVIYAPAAPDEETLALEMRRNRQAEGLLFYAIPGPGCFSNRELADKDDETFGAAETALRDSMRKPTAGALDLWTERALRLIDVAAERRVHPRALKRALSGGIWSVANAEGGIEWDEKPWLEMVEAADSDSRLKETIRELSEEIAESAGASARMSAAREEVRQAVRYLEEHYSDRVAIADVAARVGLSEPYLCQVFKADTGQSILTYLNEIRMVKAYELLASGRYLVKQAAIEVGIPDPFYFNRLFRKRFGIAPKNVKTT